MLEKKYSTSCAKGSLLRSILIAQKPCSVAWARVGQKRCRPGYLDQNDEEHGDDGGKQTSRRHFQLIILSQRVFSQVKCKKIDAKLTSAPQQSRRETIHTGSFCRLPPLHFAKYRRTERGGEGGRRKMLSTVKYICFKDTRAQRALFPLLHSWLEILPANLRDSSDMTTLVSSPSTIYSLLEPELLEVFFIKKFSPVRTCSLQSITRGKKGGKSKAKRTVLSPSPTDLASAVQESPIKF